MSKIITVCGTEIDAEQILYGPEADPVKPIVPTPVGRVRVRIRPTEFVLAFVRTETECTKHNVADCGDHWELLWSDSKNITLK